MHYRTRDRTFRELETREQNTAVLHTILVPPAQYLMNPQTHFFPTFGPTKWAYFFHPQFLRASRS
jgi:hypothetical protein